MRSDLEAMKRLALRQVRDLRIVVHSGGWVDLSWCRPYNDYLGEVVVIQAESVIEGLSQLLCLEEDYTRTREHGAWCGCEDCCIGRVDRARRMS